MNIRTLTLAALITLAPTLAVAGPFDAVNTADNAAHTPVITAPEQVKAGEPFDVTITLGKKPHPSETGHFIRFIALYAGETELARISLTPTLTRPTVTVRVILNESTTLRALSAPNHSAAWETTKAIHVK